MAILKSFGRMPTIGSTAVAVSPVPTPPVVTHAPSRPPTRMPRPSRFPRGPNLLGLGRKRQQPHGGPGLPPPGFVSATTSATEWIFYWASFKYFDLGDPRKPPYIGDPAGVVFTYQTPESGGRQGPGGSVSDFVYHLGTGDVVVRLDTWYFHIAASAQQHAKDAELKRRVWGRGVRVYTVYDAQFVHDKTGAAAVRALHAVITGKEIYSPVTSGLAYPARSYIEEVTA